MSVPAQSVKLVRVIDPAAIVDNAAYTTEEIDTLGYSYAQIYVYIGATDIAVAVLKVQESDTSGSGFADVTGLDMSTGTDMDGVAAALPSATDDNKFYVFDIDLRGRKRYLDLSATAGNGTTGTFMTAWAVLSRPAASPVTASERGLGAGMRV